MTEPRVAPHDIQAEESLLGAMLLARQAIEAASAVVHPEHFYVPAHSHIYQAILGLHGNGEPVDVVTVADELARGGLLDAIGGRATLIGLQTNAPAISPAGRYARIVEEMATLRRLIGTGGEIAELGYSMPDDVAKAVDSAESMLFDLADGRAGGEVSSLRHLLEGELDRLERLYSRGDTITGVPTGFLDLDDLTAGFQPSNLIVLGARPSVGKTSLAAGVASHVAMVARRPVLFATLEMSKGEITQRILCAEARVDQSRMRTGKLHGKDWERIGDATGRLADAKIDIFDDPNLTVLELRAKARRAKAQHGDLGLIVVDYVQLMTGRSTSETRQVEVSEIARGLKILAREVDVPVLALAQLNRGLETRADKRPMLADLRESGDLEAAADLVLFLYRDEVYNRQSVDQGIAELIVAKHRNGPTGLVRLAFLGQYTKFVNMARQ